MTAHTRRALAEGNGREVSDETIGHLSPAHFESINPYGTHTIDVAAVLNRPGRRPLRSAKRH